MLGVPTNQLPTLGPKVLGNSSPATIHHMAAFPRGPPEKWSFSASSEASAVDPLDTEKGHAGYGGTSKASMVTITFPSTIG